MTLLKCPLEYYYCPYLSKSLHGECLSVSSLCRPRSRYHYSRGGGESGDRTARGSGKSHCLSRDQVRETLLLTVLASVSHFIVNAYLFPLCAVHGLAITTVDGVGNPETGLHEVQVNHTAYLQ